MGKLGWIDSHAHLVDETLYEHIDDVIEALYDFNVQRVLSISTTIEEAYLNFDLQQKYDGIDVALGFHPSDAHIITEQEFNQLIELANDKRIVAIGEIGLDYYWQKETIEEQKDLFIRQIELANVVKKPIIVHNRDASQDVLEILKAHPVQVPGVMHCYSGSVEMAVEFIKQNMMISFAGPLTFKNARVIKEVAKSVDIQHMLIETDSPYLTPTPYRGKPNQPAYVSFIGKELSKIKEVSQQELMRQLESNYYRFIQREYNERDE